MQKYELKLTKSIDLEKDIGIRSFSGKCLLNFYCILSRASDSRMAFTLNFTVRGVNDFHPRFNTSRITIKAAKSSAKVPLVTLSQWVTDEDILEGGRIKTFRFGGNENETFFKFLDPVKGIVTFNTSIDFEEIPKNKTLSVPVQVVDDGDLSGWSTLVVTIVESPLTFSSKLYMIYTTYDYVGPLDTVPSPIRAFDRSSDDGQILYSLREGRGTGNPNLARGLFLFQFVRLFACLSFSCIPIMLFLLSVQ
ncbi:hypothetical protein RRG08_014326 [Elysia crispata]|uniref:Cadherin domain-containing protein n=1 Tax=Elysia crispata TaxID=231223 RepID=A0AAE0Z0G7_9GAST|nr:hypothetical protein RRG08_014326 [Elysia crispata]